MEVCTQCHRDGRKVEHVSALAVVDYYRCPQCGAIWTMPKESDGPDGTPRPSLPTGHEDSLV
jgi:hypothetical protein